MIITTTVTNERISALNSVGSCFLLALIYVASLYIWNSGEERNHPKTIKIRMFSVSIVTLISPIFIYLSMPKSIIAEYSIWEIMGFRSEGLWIALLLPLLLTMVLFLGPISLQFSTIHDLSTMRNYAQSAMMYKADLIWWRNHIVAPLSEEFTFRACMMPLLLCSFEPMTSVILTPLFFGIAHLHHIHEHLKTGLELNIVLKICCFQLVYTSMFGMYSAYLFFKTGHFVAPFIAHAFCNHMGFPDIQELFSLTGLKKHIIFAIFIFGFVSWIYLLPILTHPKWFSNDLYWVKTY